MTRIFVIVALIVSSHLLNFPAPVQAQVPEQFSEQNGITATGKNVVSLTTTDLLSSQDFVPQVTDLPAKRSRIVNPVKRSRNVLEAKPIMGSEGNLEKFSAATKSNVAEIGADEMVPSQRPLFSSSPEEAQRSVGTVTAGLSTGKSQLDDLIVAAAARNGIDHHLILAVMRQESSFNPQAISYKGARGLMQLMPATAARFGVRDIFDPAQNIEGGARYLRFLLNTFNGDIELALAGYNAGENAVARYGNQIPPYRETQDYVRKISAHYARLKNGIAVRRQPGLVPSVQKKAESEIITAGPTMTHY